GYEGYEYYTPQGSAPTPPGASYGYGGAPGGSSWEPPKAPELGLGSSESSAAAFASGSAPGSSSLGSSSSSLGSSSMGSSSMGSSSLGSTSLGSSALGSSALENSGADSIIAKINQRLDLLAKEGAGLGADSREQQESSFRYDSFDSYDSRPSLSSSRDPFRPGFPFGEVGSDRESPFGSRDPSRSRGSLGIPRGNSGNSG
ncbi:AKAP8 protein, partial [Vireo altiloquus]|nr:AKAP8 protein [Vireo altiloquus]